jgi:transposase InsO family protein
VLSRIRLSSDRGSEFDNARIDEMPGVFGITRSLSKKGCPFDNAVDESTNKTLKKEMACRETFADLEDLRRKLSDHVWRHDNERLHSTLNYMSPVEFRLAGLSLCKKCPEKG